MKLRSIIVMSILGLTGCVSNDKNQSKIVTPSGTKHVDPSHAPWFQGTVENALVKAKKENKPVFLYWGAVWCPPCNEIKSEVFSNSKFESIVAPTIPVYLDGDTERAQIWSDKLQVGGYPTILLLSPEGKELIRISGGVNIQEFSDVIQSGIAVSGGLDEAIAKATSGKAKEADWKLLAYFSWGQLPDDREIKINDRLKLFKLFAEKCPATLKKEKAIFAANFIETNAEAQQGDDKKAKTTAEQNRKNANKYLDAMIGNSDSILANRNSIAYNTPDILNWGWPKGDKNREAVKKKLLAAAKTLREDKKISVDTRLWAHYPILQLELVDIETPKDSKKVPTPSDATKTMIRDAVAQADRQATSSYQRMSVISGAAYLLRKIGEYDLARQILRKELAMTTTPYYYQSSFAGLEKSAGNDNEALKWMKKARLSANGRATKLQWIVSDLKMNADIKSKDQEANLVELTELYYQTAFDLPDGFSGRNKYRANAVAKSLAEWSKKKKFATIIESAKKKCPKKTSKNQIQCLEHFAKYK
jgi:protein disulfide-isomerase